MRTWNKTTTHLLSYITNTKQTFFLYCFYFSRLKFFVNAFYRTDLQKYVPLLPETDNSEIKKCTFQNPSFFSAKNCHKAVQLVSYHFVTKEFKLFRRVIKNTFLKAFGVAHE